MSRKIKKISIFMLFTKFKGIEVVSSYGESYSSIIELLSNFRIDGKRICDVWDEVEF